MTNNYFNISNITFSNSDIAKGITLPKKMTHELAEEIGLHVGDGSMNYYSGKGLYQLRGHLIDDRNHYLGRISYLYKNLYNLRVSIRNMESTGVLGFQIWSDALAEFKHKMLGLPLGKKDNIALPSVINTELLFYSFLRGFFDTDGSIYFENKRGKPYPRIDLKTTSGPLATEIMRRLNLFGIRTAIYKYTRPEPGWNDLYSVMVRGFPQIEKWINKIGSNNPKHLNKFRANGIEWI